MIFMTHSKYSAFWACHLVIGILASSLTCPAPLFLQLSNCTVAGTSVHSWGVRLDLADPSQYLCVVPSTVVNSTLVITSDFCQTNSNLTAAQCQSLCGNTFNISAAGPSFTSSSASELLDRNPVWKDISPEKLLAGTTELQLPPGSSADNRIPNYPLGIITKGNHQNAGHLGLTNQSDFFEAALSNGIIPAKGFGLNAGSQSVNNPRDGGIVLGGYDLASIGGAFTHYPIAATGPSQRECPLQVTITGLVVRFPQAQSFKDVVLISSGILIPACIEPYDNLFRFPQTILESFQAATGWSASITANHDLYIVEPGLFYPQTNAFNGSLIITLNNGFEVEIPNEELSNPLRGINTNGARVLQANTTEVKIFSESALLNTAVLGKVFLSQAYLAVEYAAGQFSLAPVIQSHIDVDVVPFKATSGNCSSTSKGGSGWNGWKIALVVLLGLVAVLLGIIIGCFWKSHIQPWLSRVFRPNKNENRARRAREHENNASIERLSTAYPPQSSRAASNISPQTVELVEATIDPPSVFLNSNSSAIESQAAPLDPQLNRGQGTGEHENRASNEQRATIHTPESSLAATNVSSSVGGMEATIDPPAVFSSRVTPANERQAGSRPRERCGFFGTYF